MKAWGFTYFRMGEKMLQVVVLEAQYCCQLKEHCSSPTTDSYSRVCLQTHMVSWFSSCLFVLMKYSIMICYLIFFAFLNLPSVSLSLRTSCCKIYASLLHHTREESPCQSAPRTHGSVAEWRPPDTLKYLPGITCHSLYMLLLNELIDLLIFKHCLLLEQENYIIYRRTSIGFVFLYSWIRLHK